MTADRRHGFIRASTLVQSRVATAAEGRGFAVSRVLTHWDEVVGPDIAAMCRPVGISYGKGGMGATLTVLTTGAQAPIVDMMRDRLRDRVNAAYGHRAVNHVRITQTAATGFAEGRAAFAPAPRQPDPKLQARAAEVAEDVQDTELRLALGALAHNVLSQRKR
jgi:hypothetical protein